MIPRAKLEALTTEALMSLKNGVEAVLADRLDTRVIVGRYGEFQHPVGIWRKVQITKINQKTASVVEVGDSIEPGKNWRVGISQIKMTPVAKRQPTKYVAPHMPTTVAVGDSW